MTVAYDKAKYQTDAPTWPDDLPPEAAYTPTGMFLGWVIERGFCSKAFETDFADELAAFRRRELTGPQLFAIMDGVLTDEDLAAELQPFASVYLGYADFHAEFEDRVATGLPTPFHVPDTWPNYEKARDMIDAAYARSRRGLGARLAEFLARLGRRTSA